MQVISDRELAERLEEKIRVLSLRCIDAMYADPFWQARFGGRGRDHAEADSAYHVKYVAGTLRADDLGLFRNYAVWLRGVLASRGMCSWHLTESFRQLTNAMHVEGIAGVSRAAEVLEEGARALVYRDGAAGELDSHRPELRGSVLTALTDGPAYRVEELLSFLADAVARADADSFKNHVAFLDRSLVRDDAERRALAATLGALRDGVRTVLTEDGARAALRVLDNVETPAS